MDPLPADIADALPKATTSARSVCGVPLLVFQPPFSLGGTTLFSNGNEPIFLHQTTTEFTVPSDLDFLESRVLWRVCILYVHSYLCGWNYAFPWDEEGFGSCPLE